MEGEIKKGAQEHDRDTIRQDAWKSEITGDHITPDAPEELRGIITLRALSDISDASQTVEEFFGRVALWEKGNNPHLPIAVLLSKVFWALNHWTPGLGLISQKEDIS